MRTFAVFGLDLSRGGQQWQRVRSETGMKVSPLDSLPFPNGRPANSYFASDGTYVADVAQDYANLQYTTTGTLLAPGPGGRGYTYTLSQVPSYASVRGAWWDGRAYLVGLMYGDGNTGDPNARFTISRYSVAMGLLDLGHGDGRDVIPDKFHPGMDVAPVMATDGEGRSLIAYLYADPMYGGVTLKGMIVREDGTRSGLVATPTCTTGDFFELGGAHLVEGGGVGTDPGTCDPSIFATYAPFTPSTSIVMNRNYLADIFNPDDFIHREYLAIDLDGARPTTFPATYRLVPDSATDFRYYFTRTSGQEMCQATGGTLTLTAYGPVGGRIEGSYSGVTWSGPPCPAATSGSFSITREADFQ
jgi:hypothetical protein